MTFKTFELRTRWNSQLENHLNRKQPCEQSSFPLSKLYFSIYTIELIRKPNLHTASGYRVDVTWSCSAFRRPVCRPVCRPVRRLDLVDLTHRLRLRVKLFSGARVSCVRSGLWRERFGAISVTVRDHSNGFWSAPVSTSGQRDEFTKWTSIRYLVPRSPPAGRCRPGGGTECGCLCGERSVRRVVDTLSEI